MRRFDNWTQRTASFEETPKGFHNPPEMMDFSFGRKKFSVQLSAGSSDTVDVYRDGDSLFVMTSNNRLNYVGLEVFALKGDYAGEKIGEFFEQNPDDNEALRDWQDHSVPFVIRVMTDYVEV